MKTIVKFFILLLALSLFLCSCTKSLPESEFLSYYEENCKTEYTRGGITFYAMLLSSDYEKAKWGAPLDNGMRVLFWATPRSDLSIENATLYAGSDSSDVVLFRKAQTFELGATDSFVLSFAERNEWSKLYVRNVSQGIGGIEMELKNCKNIRLIEK